MHEDTTKLLCIVARIVYSLQTSLPEVDYTAPSAITTDFGSLLLQPNCLSAFLLQCAHNIQYIYIREGDRRTERHLRLIARMKRRVWQQQSKPFGRWGTKCSVLWTRSKQTSLKRYLANNMNTITNCHTFSFEEDIIVTL